MHSCRGWSPDTYWNVLSVWVHDNDDSDNDINPLMLLRKNQARDSHALVALCLILQHYQSSQHVVGIHLLSIRLAQPIWQRPLEQHCHPSSVTGGWIRHASYVHDDWWLCQPEVTIPHLTTLDNSARGGLKRIGCCSGMPNYHQVSSIVRQYENRGGGENSYFSDESLNKWI